MRFVPEVCPFHRSTLEKSSPCLGPADFEKSLESAKFGNSLQSGGYTRGSMRVAEKTNGFVPVIGVIHLHTSLGTFLDVALNLEQLKMTRTIDVSGSYRVLTVCMSMAHLQFSITARR